jgi:hypothetical protein
MHSAIYENQSLTPSATGVGSMEMKQPRKEFSLNRGASKSKFASVSVSRALHSRRTSQQYV